MERRDRLHMKVVRRRVREQVIRVRRRLGRWEEKEWEAWDRDRNFGITGVMYRILTERVILERMKIMIEGGDRGSRGKTSRLGSP